VKTGVIRVQHHEELKMRLNGQDFIIIGENVHTTRVVRRKGKLVTNNPDGLESVRYLDRNKKRRYLVIPESIKKSQEYEEGRVKHVIIAVQAAMSGEEPHASEGLEYIRRIVQRQVDVGTDFLDVNVDEISWRLEEQKEAMRWLVQALQQMSDTPLSIDSSNSEIIAAGLEVYDSRVGRALLNSASLERLDALDLAKQYNTKVMVTAASESGMPQNPEERVTNASRMIDAAQDRGIAIADIFIDPLFFPIGVDTENGNHAFEAIRQLREKYGPDIHISGGFSNVSFQMPCRSLINDVFMILAVEAGADSGIIDPVTNNPQRALSVDRASSPYQLTEAMLLGKDRFCRTFLRAYRKGELEG
jgi:5-methyltetrahydrofolate--homocysteine methyltransferase